MENQWRDIRRAYKRIIEHAFRDEDKRDEATAVLLKLCASVIDLSLLGDATLKNAISALLGDDGLAETHSSYSNQSTRDDRVDHSRQNSTPSSNLPNNPNIPNSNASNGTTTANIPFMSSSSSPLDNIQNFSNLFSLAGENLLGRHQNESTLNPFITAEELRNLFPLWNMFDSTIASSSTPTVPQETSSTVQSTETSSNVQQHNDEPTDQRPSDAT